MSRLSGFLMSSWLRKRARRKATAGERLIRLRQERDSLLRTARELKERGIPVNIPKLSRGGLTKGARIAGLEQDVKKLKQAIDEAGKKAAKETKAGEEQARVARRITEAFQEAKKEEGLADLAFDYVEGRIPKKELDRVMSKLKKEDRKILLKWLDIATVEVIARKMVYGIEISEEEARFLESMPKELRAHLDFSKEFYSLVERMLDAGDIGRLSQEDRGLYEWIKQDPYWSKRLKKTLEERAG